MVGAPAKKQIQKSLRLSAAVREIDAALVRVQFVLRGCTHHRKIKSNFKFKNTKVASPKVAFWHCPNFAGVTPRHFSSFFVDFRGSEEQKSLVFCGQNAISEFSPIFVKTHLPDLPFLGVLGKNQGRPPKNIEDFFTPLDPQEKTLEKTEKNCWKPLENTKEFPRLEKHQGNSKTPRNGRSGLFSGRGQNDRFSKTTVFDNPEKMDSPKNLFSGPCRDLHDSQRGEKIFTQSSRPALLQKLIGDFFSFPEGIFGGNFWGFFWTHKIKALKFLGKKFGAFFRGKIS